MVFPVLRRIRQLEKKLIITDGRLPPIRDIFSRLSSKLSDAEGFLQKATSALQETEDRNRASVLKLQRNEVTLPAECISPLKLPSQCVRVH